MSKQKLEKMFSASIKNTPSLLYGMKLHNNPLAHQTTPADFLLSSNYGPEVNYPQLHLVECKQVTCENGKGRLAFKRLKQLHDLLSFENHFEHHHAFFCIVFYNGTWANSDIYIVPVKEMEFFIYNHPMVSVNKEDMKSAFNDRLVLIQKGGVIDIWPKLK